MPLWFAVLFAAHLGVWMLYLLPVGLSIAIARSLGRSRRVGLGRRCVGSWCASPSACAANARRTRLDR